LKVAWLANYAFATLVIVYYFMRTCFSKPFPVIIVFPYCLHLDKRCMPVFVGLQTVVRGVRTVGYRGVLETSHVPQRRVRGQQGSRELRCCQEHRRRGAAERPGEPADAEVRHACRMFLCLLPCKRVFVSMADSDSVQVGSQF